MANKSTRTTARSGATRSPPHHAPATNPKAPPAGDDRIGAVIVAARLAGLLGGKAGRISGRVSPELLAAAKRKTGIQADTALMEFALANIAIEDNFAAAFKESRATVDPDLKLGF